MRSAELQICATKVDESGAKERQFLDFIVATLRESWGITLHIRVIELFKDLIANRGNHWRTQMEGAHRLLSNATDGVEGFLYAEESPEAWSQLSSFLQTELKFISQCQQEVQAFVLETRSLRDTQSDLVELLNCLHTSQIAVMQRMWEVESFIPRHGDEERNLKAA